MKEKFIAILSQIKDEYESKLFIPILEDDFVARFYFHLLNSDYSSLSNKVFVKTRILHDIKELNKDNKYDIVVGDRKLNDKCDYVDPKAVLEFKIFPFGFTPQQLSKRREGVIEDIHKLSLISKYSNRNIELYICLFDLIGWLHGYNQNEKITRLKKFYTEKQSVNPNISIIGITDIGNGDLQVFNF